MKFGFKRKNQRYTVLVVPEGSQPVFRLKMTSTYLLAGLVAAAVLLVTALVLFTLNRSHAFKIAALEAKLTASSEQLQATVSDKEQEIDRLLLQLVELSEKSKTLETKMTELELLEAELKSITNGERAGSGIQSASASSSQNSDGGWSTEGMGGELIPLSEEDVDSLIEETRESISASLEEMPALQARLEQTKEAVTEYKKMMRILPTFWPADSLTTTSPFGKRLDPFTGKLTLHNGLDIKGNIGDLIYAAADGTVAEAGYSTSRGNYVTISHPSGLSTNYLHLNEISTEKGKKVKQGDVIGTLGSTGRSTGPHLHFEVVKNGVMVDPEIYLIKPEKDEDE
ncbi:peptidoglycan DD-metalloendopeptidase family protein [Paenibacillus woosongensis]|uniref:Peptidoglycan DD-metalloendopeptidase family protein n=1 Tax=Paenibacillus woosongensis TaxID=307580 RepID=A0A7X3CMU3_9BACL|nr:peptidoglycan DD-metalloendopeptidase family protein [Paenibacillus woosongensis]MUG46003.1 peptidoglycan DD-metalloendopeptidase family protein [Paenibacillus woosongensis]